MPEWDVFLSHASEDKAAVAQPLAQRLTEAGLEVWLDAAQLHVGDSLRVRIEEGLSNARVVVLVLSPAFLDKKWPQRELDATLELEIARGTRIFPVLHDLDHDSVVERVPLLANKISVSTSDGLGVVAREICRALGRPATDTPATKFASPQDLLGTDIHGYTLIEHVGSGGSGSVFAAGHPRHRGKLAMKVFFPLKAGYRHLAGLFERGFRAVAAVRHPNVVRVIDSGPCVVDGAPTAFMVTDFIDGLLLDDWARTATPPRKLAVARTLAEALATCHATRYVDDFGIQTQGVFHGDIKPANIIVDAEGQPHLIDFLQIDVQRLIDIKVGQPGVSSRPTTAAFGTPGYMAPEQERHGVITPATDIYGLGMTLMSLFGFDPSIRDLLFSMIADDPIDRPRSMAGVVAALPKA